MKDLISKGYEDGLYKGIHVDDELMTAAITNITTIREDDVTIHILRQIDLHIGKFGYLERGGEEHLHILKNPLRQTQSEEKPDNDVDGSYEVEEFNTHANDGDDNADLHMVNCNVVRTRLNGIFLDICERIQILEKIETEFIDILRTLTLDHHHSSSNSSQVDVFGATSNRGIHKTRGKYLYERSRN